MQAKREGNASLGQDVLNLPDVLRGCLRAGMIALDAEHKIVLFNNAAEEITGLSAKEILQHPASVLPDALRRALEAKASSDAREIELTTPAHGKRLVRITLATEHSPDGGVSRVTAVLHDLTAVRAFEQTSRRLDRLASIGTLSAGMAHEIKNAMVAVKTFVDVLISRNQDAALAEIVDREMRRINAIVSQMLRFAGPARRNFAAVHVHETVEQSLTVMQHHLEGRKVSVIRALTAPDDTVRGDDYQLEQVFLNLFFNALDAMGPGGRLTIATEVIPPDQSELLGTPALRISVRDSGVGVPPENLARLFEPFFTTKADGTGLGLPITRRIIQEHRGVITVDSQPGQGTTFNILLPLAP